MRYQDCKNSFAVQLIFDCLTSKQKLMIKNQMVNLWLSDEAVMDLYWSFKSLFAIRTPEPSDKEIADWQSAYKMVCELDTEKVKEKYNVQIDSDRSWWYKDYPNFF